MEYGKKFFNFLDMEYVDFRKNTIESGCVPILNVFNADDNKKMTDMISETLSNSSYLVSMTNV